MEISIFHSKLKLPVTAFKITFLSRGIVLNSTKYNFGEGFLNISVTHFNEHDL